MPNNYFQFKQFTIQQDKCAMKVTTDGCLFGATVAKEISDKKSCRVLDIGAGTGLLSLMVAQENDTTIIDAVELDEVAADQAKENVEASDWSDSIKVIAEDIMTADFPRQYDFIISNPPFYEQQLGSPNAGRQMAHHSSGLTLLQLLEKVNELLEPDGKFYMLLPFFRTEEAIELAKASGLIVEKQWQVKQSSKHPFFRTIFCFGRNQPETYSHFEITIRDEAGSYTGTFSKLLQPFYLHL